MKRYLLSLVIVLSIVFAQGAACSAAPETGKEELKGTVTISGAWALYPMVVKWAEEFQKIHPGVKFDISAGGAGKGMADAIGGMVDIGMVSRGIHAEEEAKGAWWVAVTKDAVVPTMNSGNPAVKEVLSKGISRDIFKGIWVDKNITTWAQVTGGASARTINVYTRSDACGAAETWAKYLGANQEDLTGVGVFGDPGLAEAVRKDVLGVGYNNIIYAYDTKTGLQLEGIAIIPIDINGNGTIDKEEDFYRTKDEIIRAIADGRYPSPPARDLNFVSKGRPERKETAEFIKWVLTDGQQYVGEAGYIGFTAEKIEAQLLKLKGE